MATKSDPFALIDSCHKALQAVLRNSHQQPIQRLWIDHPYGEEELCLLEEELLPAMEAVLKRVDEIDKAVEANQAAAISPVEWQRIWDITSL